MAEIRDTLVLEIDQALRQINQIEASLDRALAPVEVEVEVEVDTRNVDNLEDALRRVERFASDITVETQALAFEAGRAEVNFEQLAQALDVSEDEARRLTGEIIETRAAAIRLEAAARDVAQQLGLSESEASGLTRELRQADRAADAIDTRTAGLATSFGSLRTAAAGVAGAFAAIGGAQLLGAAVRGANTAVQRFAELEDSVNAVKVVFDEGADTVFRFGETVAQSAGISELSFQQALVPIGALLTNFGFNALEAADASTVLLQRAADLASLLGGDVQTALAAINSALIGQVEPLRAYGGEVSQARVQQLALAEGIIQTGEGLTTAAAVQARYQLILQDTAFAAGDFARTSEDFANAQRTAAAEAEKVVTTFGEALLPAFEALIQQAPAVLNFFESLAPALGRTADEAARASSGLTTFVSGVTLGLGSLPDLAGGVVDVGQGFVALFDDIIALDPSFAGLNEQIDDFNSRVGNELVRIAAQSIPAAMEKGAGGIDAFTEAISFLGRQSDTTRLLEQSFERLAIVAGLTDAELADVTEFLIQNADAAALTAGDIDFLRDRLTALLPTLGPLSNELAQARVGFEQFFDQETANVVTTRFTTFVDTVGEQVDRLPTFTERIREATAATVEALDPFAEASENIETSAREFFQNLVDQVEQQAEFQANIARLVGAGFDDVAAEIAKAGPGANRAAEQFLANLSLADKAERLLEGEGTAISRQVGDELTGELSNLTPEIQNAFVTLMNEGVFTNQQVADAIEDGSISAANRTVSEYREGLIDGFAEFDAAGIAASVEEAIGGSLDFSDLAYEKGLDTARGFERGVKDGLEITSPSRVMMRLAEQAAEGFVLGWEQADLNLRLPTLPVTGSVATGAGVGVSGGDSFTFAPTYVNTETRDLETVVARSEQTMAAVSGLLGKVKLV